MQANNASFRREPSQNVNLKIGKIHVKPNSGKKEKYATASKANTYQQRVGEGLAGAIMHASECGDGRVRQRE
jgi:hypothetical protein